MSATRSLTEDVTAAVATGSVVPLDLGTANDAGPLQPGASVGRYLAIEEIGRGGMGVVLRAYDPRLQREVALKSVRTDTIGAEAQTRMLREAQAMAKLSHPNVVAVYDVEVEGENVVLAMEYVRGKTLKEWLADQGSEEKPQRRPWREIVDTFIAAGRGVAAAHEAGLLHRDFKPANVLIGEDGRARVTDFGLARLSEHQTVVPYGAQPYTGEHTGEATSPDLTQAGLVLGTPRYMAPEQHDRGELGPATDQYAFCVALWEGLVGRPPFTGNGQEFIESKRKGPPAWPRDVAVPRRIVDAIERGLAPKQSERWPSMLELLETLAYDPRQRRRTYMLAGSVATTLGASGVVWAAWQQQQMERCTGAQEQLTGVWDADLQSAVEQSFKATNAVYADAAWKKVAPQLDNYANQWVSQHTEACEATTVRGEQSNEVMELKMACLNRAKAELGAATTLLSHADASIVANSYGVVDSLRDLERCSNVEALQADVPAPEEGDREAVAAIRDEVAQVVAMLALGKVSEGLALAEDITKRAEAIEYAPLRTDVYLALGEARKAAGKYADAETALKDAMRSGLEWKQWPEAEKAVTTLVAVIGDEQARPGEALAFAETAHGLLEFVGPARKATLHGVLGAVVRQQGKWADAETEYRTSMDIVEKTFGADHVGIAKAKAGIGKVFVDAGRFTEAETELRAALAMWEGSLGPNHPQVAVVRNLLGDALEGQGRHPEAELEYRAAMETTTTAFDATHPDIAIARSSLGRLFQNTGRLAEAETEHRAALALREKGHGPEHASVAESKFDLANVLAQQGRHTDAETEYRAAIELWSKTIGAEHPRVADAKHGLGRVLEAQARHAEAEPEHRAAMALREKVLTPEHPALSVSRRLVSGVLIAQGKHNDALPVLEQAWAAHEKDEKAPAADKGFAAFALAKSLWETNGDKAKARTLAETARTLYQSAEGKTTEVAEVEAWLKSHNG